MINRLIRWSLENRLLVLGATLLLFGWGIFAVRRVPVDAIPDLSENQVIVFADWEGRSPREVEDQVTYPLSVNLQGLAGVRSVRASSSVSHSLWSASQNSSLSMRIRVISPYGSGSDTSAAAPVWPSGRLHRLSGRGAAW